MSAFIIHVLWKKIYVCVCGGGGGGKYTGTVWCYHPYLLLLFCYPYILLIIIRDCQQIYHCLTGKMARATVITRQFCKANFEATQRSNVQPGHCNALVHHFGELFICTYNGLSLSLSLLSPHFHFFPSLSIFLISGCDESPGAWVELMLYTVDPLTIVH